MPAAMAKQDKARKAPAASADQLKDEVKAFASQLGLGSGGGEDFGFDDFAPAKASAQAAKKAPAQGQREKQQQQQQHGKPVKHQQPQPQKGKRISGPATSGAPAAQRGRQPQQQQGSGKEEDDIRGRGWKEGVGPRPGEQWPRDLCIGTCPTCAMPIRAYTREVPCMPPPAFTLVYASKACN